MCQNYAQTELRLFLEGKWKKLTPRRNPTIALICAYLEGLTQPSATCKLLNVQDSHRLKRLASVVQLRPWPPFILGLYSMV